MLSLLVTHRGSTGGFLSYLHDAKGSLSDLNRMMALADENQAERGYTEQRSGWGVESTRAVIGGC